MNIPHGEVTGALPDGRLAGEAFCDASSPMMGRDICGPTATVKSVAAIDQPDLQEARCSTCASTPRACRAKAAAALSKA